MMNPEHSEILSAIRSYGRFTDRDITLFSSKIRTNELPKGSLLLQPGEISQSIYFIVNGSMRMYWMNEDNEECTKDLFIQGDWALDRDSFTTQKPSDFYLQVYENSVIQEVLLCDLHEIIGQSPAFFSLGRVIYSDGHQKNTKQALKPEEKYLDLLNNRPALIQKFPLKQIASMLGMTPETLSRVRRKIH